jgi:hypothetical protein
MGEQKPIPAFPFHRQNGSTSDGMDLRDYFAAAALQGLLSGNPDADCEPIGYAKDAYLYADQMLKARDAS